LIELNRNESEDIVLEVHVRGSATVRAEVQSAMKGLLEELGLLRKKKSA
jgi:hypothetical protein